MSKIPFYFDSSDKNSMNGFTREYTDSSDLFEPIKYSSFANSISFLNNPTSDNNTYFKVYNHT